MYVNEAFSESALNAMLCRKLYISTSPLTQARLRLYITYRRVCYPVNTADQMHR